MVIGVCLRLSARSAGDIGVSLVITGVLLREYSPADSRKQKTDWGNETITTITAVHAFLAEIKFRNQGKSLESVA